MIRRIHHGTRKPANWMQLLKFGLVGGSGYAVNLAVFALLTAALRHPSHPRRDRRLLRRRDQQLLVEPPLDLRRRATAMPAFRRRASSPSASLGLGFNLALLELFVTGLELPELPAQALAVALTMPVNFVGNKLWTFDDS